MSTPSNWRDVTAMARAADPTWDSDERVTRRAGMREEMPIKPTTPEAVTIAWAGRPVATRRSPPHR